MDRKGRVLTVAVIHAAGIVLFLVNFADTNRPMLSLIVAAMMTLAAAGSAYAVWRPVPRPRLEQAYLRGYDSVTPLHR